MAENTDDREHGDWDKGFHGITVKYGDSIVHITVDSALMTYLDNPGNGSIELSKHILTTYRQRFGSALNISEESMSVEILIHAYLDVFSKGVEKLSAMISKEILKALIDLMRKIEGHTEVIDSGEASVDGNRHVFDSLVPYRKILYLVLGKAS
jgi:hypothetical protein